MRRPIHTSPDLEAVHNLSEMSINLPQFTPNKRKFPDSETSVSEKNDATYSDLDPASEDEVLAFKKSEFENSMTEEIDPNISRTKVLLDTTPVIVGVPKPEVTFKSKLSTFQIFNDIQMLFSRRSLSLTLRRAIYSHTKLCLLPNTKLLKTRFKM